MSNGRLEPELWHVQLIDRIGVILTINLAMSVLIDKSVCPHASGQQTAMHVCDERGRGARAGGGGAGGLARGRRARTHPQPVLITFMHGCPLSRCMRTDRLVDEDGHGDFDLPHTVHIRVIYASRHIRVIYAS